MPSSSICQELYNRERGINAALQGLNPKSPQFDTVAARMTDALNKLRSDASLLDDPAEQSLLKERTKIIEKKLIEARIPKELDTLASDLKTIELVPENQAALALDLHQKIQQLINHKAPMLSPDQRQRLAEMQKRAMDLVPEAPEDRRIRLARSFGLARGVRPLLRGMRDSLRELVLLEKDAKSLFIDFRQSHKEEGTALTKRIWTKGGQLPVDHFGSKVLRGDTVNKMRTRDIVDVIDDQLAYFPAGRNLRRAYEQEAEQLVRDGFQPSLNAAKAFIRSVADEQIADLDPKKLAKGIQLTSSYASQVKKDVVSDQAKEELKSLAEGVRKLISSIEKAEKGIKAAQDSIKAKRKEAARLQKEFNDTYPAGRPADREDRYEYDRAEDALNDATDALSKRVRAQQRAIVELRADIVELTAKRDDKAAKFEQLRTDLFPNVHPNAEQKLKNLRRSIIQQRIFLFDIYDKLKAIDPALFRMLVGYLEKEIATTYPTEFVLKGIVFSDPRSVITALNRMIDSFDHAEGYQPFPLLPDALVSHLGQFLTAPDMYFMRKADTRCASGLLTDFYLLPLRENIDRGMRTLTPLPITRELREAFFVGLIFRIGGHTSTEEIYTEIAKNPLLSLSRGIEVNSNAELDRLVSLIAPMNGGALIIESKSLRRISDRLGELQGLRNLTILCDRLQELPPSLGLLSKLHHLYIQFPYLNHSPDRPLPSSYRNLTELDSVDINFGAHRIHNFEDFLHALPPAEAAASSANNSPSNTED